MNCLIMVNKITKVNYYFGYKVKHPPYGSGVSLVIAVLVNNGLKNLGDQLYW